MLEYVEEAETISLPPSTRGFAPYKASPLKAIELFAGAGGLGIGFSHVGVKHLAVVEWNRHACETLRHNKRNNVEPMAHWPDVFEGDVRNFSYDSFGHVDLITGGPPCQPFSMGGKHRGFLDERDMFPQAIRAVRETRPRAFVFENVRGLVRKSFSDYFNYIIRQLQHPSVTSKPGEEWLDHFKRLDKHAAKSAPEYIVSATLVNAANYGVPQKRERVIFVGFRSDQYRPWTFPTATHSHEALLHSQWITGDYWDRHKVALKDRPSAPDLLPKKQAELHKLASEASTLPWLTVRDAISDLPDPELTPKLELVQAHRFQPGARSYPGHTGSPLDEPSKALKAGGHGVPGGENMLRRPNGSIRYFTVRESARIQTFPDSFLFEGSWGEVMRQLGNAVPVRLASTVAKSVCEILNGK
mgnify:CR=1 FL=1